MTTFPRLLRPSPILQYAKTGRPARGDPRNARIVPQNGLARELERYGRKAFKYPQNYGPFKRANVVDEQLCGKQQDSLTARCKQVDASQDDTLNSLAPSLEHFKGCDIIDILPGPGLWSRKVHEYLRPLNHTLVDINQDRFEPFLRNLTEQPGSRYQYKGMDYYTKGGRRNAYSEEALAGLSHGRSGDQRPLLVLATMTMLRGAGIGQAEKTAEENSGKWKRTVDFANHVPADYSPSEGFFYEVLSKWQTLLEHQKRPVRYLVWMLDRDKFNFLPRSISGRKITAFELDESFELQEIAGSSEPSRKIRGMLRPAHFEVQSSLTVAKRMKEEGVMMPEHRQPPLHAFIKRQLNVSDPLEIEQELAAMETLEHECMLEALVTDSKKRNAATSDARKKLEAIYADFERTWSSSSRTQYGRTLRYLGLSRITCALECSIASRKPTEEYIIADDAAPGGFIIKHPSTEKSFDISAMTKLCDQHADPGNSYDYYTAQAFTDNRSAIDRPTPGTRDAGDAEHTDLTSPETKKPTPSPQALPPILAWDNRPSEPLEVNQTDFYPQHPLALLSLTPRKLKRPPISRLPLVRKLVRQEAISLPVALDRLAHGASDAILPNCPSINDPLRGGRLPQNLMHLRIRMMTLQMWHELVEAWYKWPFRREDMEMEAEVGTSSVFMDFDNEG